MLSGRARGNRCIANEAIATSARNSTMTVESDRKNLEPWLHVQRGWDIQPAASGSSYLQNTKQQQEKEDDTDNGQHVNSMLKSLCAEVFPHGGPAT